MKTIRKTLTFEAPDWAEWESIDENGKWYVYDEDEPKISDSGSNHWISSGRIELIAWAAPHANWRKTKRIIK